MSNDIDDLTNEIRIVDLAVSDQIRDMKGQMYLQSAVQIAILLVLALIFIALVTVPPRQAAIEPMVEHGQL